MNAIAWAALSLGVPVAVGLGRATVGAGVRGELTLPLHKFTT